MSHSGRFAAIVAPPPPFSVGSAHFDGTNDNMTRGAGLTGAGNDALGIIFFWVNFTGGDGVIQTISRDAIADSNWGVFKLGTGIGTDNTIRVPLAVVAGGTGCYKDTTATLTSSSGWTPVLISYDTNHLAGSRVIQVYFGETDAGGTIVDNPPNVAFAVDITSTDWGIGGQTDNTWRLNADLAEFYFCPGQYLDISIAANRRKFFTAGLKSVNLGAVGSLPTGTVPLIYQHLDLGEPPADFAINRGTGGNFGITGLLTTGSSPP